jgi:hypothetical protein
MPTAAPSDDAVGRLVEITKFYDREEAVAAAAALDSSGLFVVLCGLDLIGATPVHCLNGAPTIGRLT